MVGRAPIMVETQRLGYKKRCGATFNKESHPTQRRMG